MLRFLKKITSSIRRASFIYRVEETNPDNLIKGRLVLYKNGLLEFKGDKSHEWISLGNKNVQILVGSKCQELLDADRKLENGFVIVLAEKKYFFKCDTVEEMDLWVFDLHSTIQKITAKNEIQEPIRQLPLYNNGTFYDAQCQHHYNDDTCEQQPIKFHCEKVGETVEESWSTPLKLAWDASPFGISAVVSHELSNESKALVAFGSRTP
ncbi:hypothetical protein T4A_8968 [Trichinella pseudospiralis]|uniref:PH domain-containing protein n=1 Tax=Trichinella pseudospiralis TaxID=6337 RepID=A0A0V1ESC7_TRIPS|nr:hypothetical protein T4A_8968 [Trichinella pseudospiralis]